MYTLSSLVAPVQAPTVMPIDVTAIVAIIMGMMVVLIPIAGVTARFALKPIAEAVARVREASGTTRELQVVEQRLSLLEQQLSNLETDVREIEDKSDFDRQLAAGPNE